MITNKNCRFPKEGIFLRLLIAALISFGAVIARAAGERIPAGYTEIEYIQGNGWDTRIVTDYTPQPNTDKIEAVVEWPEKTLAANVNQAVWCARGNGTQADSWTLFAIGTQFRFDYMPNGHAVSLTPKFTTSTGTKYTITAENNTVTYSANGSVPETQSTPEYSYTAGSVLALFASHYSGINFNVGNWGKHRLYSFKVWRSGALIHYFVPCKDSSDVATLVDICESPATLTKHGTFTAGSEGHYYDDMLFVVEDVLAIAGNPSQYGSPSPAYGRRSGLEAGETVAVSCGAAVATNDEDRVYACAGWKLYDENGNVVSNGLEASFTYTHPTPATYRKLEWQWREPFVILPIPDQNYNFGDICRPELTVSNVVSAATWTIGGDIESPDFDVEYMNNVGAGVARVTVTNTGAYPGATASATFNISATALEDANLSTTDNTARRLEMDGKYVYIFTNAASAASVTLKRNLVLTDALLVAGGGAGGNTMAGGGGAGGFIELAGVYARYDVGDEITFTVGAGGAVATGQNRGGKGGDTIFTLGETTHTAKGGGGGGGWSSAVGSSGGSGGGSTRDYSVGLGVEGQGHAGARSAKGATSSTGGGGGAGESGHGPTTSPARSGDGGAGRLFAITGEYYGGGGGGGGSVKEYGTALAGSGGLGGGGDGGRDTGGADGADGYGGGGGGGGYNGANQFGGKGGSGTVILVFRQTDLGVNPIPDQSLDEGGVCRPSFTVVNTRTSQSWTVGGDSESPNFDVEYTNNTAIGVAGVTLIGKGVYAGERFYTTFRIISDSNIATDDLTVRTFTTGGRTVYVFKNAALGRTTVTARRGLFLADALLVGGGGAGGNTMGAGGGGGGVLQLNGVNAVYKPNDTFSLTVGAGGVISATAGYRGSSGSKTSLEFGVSSGMNAVIVAGGGAGGAWSTNPASKGRLAAVAAKPLRAARAPRGSAMPGPPASETASPAAAVEPVK